MPKQIRLNAFDMNCIGHQSPGLWTHPRDHAADYNTLEYWVDLARTLERGRFDALFLADVLGIYDVYQGSPRTALENAVQVPVNDPLMVIPAMAYVTQHLGFGVTCALSYEHPYPFARRMSTLDHLTRGRIGWNIVTGYLESAARGMGMTQQVGHDDRYEIAEDYLRAVYQLWEASWEDGAVLRDRAGRQFADAGKIHRITHDGPHFKVDAIHLCEPSPQRTPVLYQAGASARGRQFAAQHAECVFINGPSKKVVGGIAADLRLRAATCGRDPAELIIFAMMTVITDTTSARAKAKHQDYLGYVSEEGALALMSGWTGVDFSALPRDEPIRFTTRNAMTSALEAFTTADPDRTWTVSEIARHAAIGGRGPVLVGSGAEIADAFQDWVRETDIDGFNLAYALTPETFTDIVDLVVPELQSRGVYKHNYAPGTLREKLYGGGRARLPDFASGGARQARSTGGTMNAEELRAIQAPLKQAYRQNPNSARIPARAEGIVEPYDIACTVQAWHGEVTAGLHKAGGGTGELACSADMLLEALVACAGVTLRAVATAMGVTVNGGRIIAEGMWDARGTLGIDRAVPVGLSEISLRFDIDCDADAAKLERVIQTTERYCVILQTLRNPPKLSVASGPD